MGFQEIYSNIKIPAVARVNCRGSVLGFGFLVVIDDREELLTSPIAIIPAL